MLPVSPTLPKPQFRAVILCGYGIDLFPLVEPIDHRGGATTTSTTTSTSTVEDQSPQIKPLLPVGGKPMIDWVISTCQQSGTYDILVLSPQSISKPIQHHLRQRKNNKGEQQQQQQQAKVELEEVPEGVAARGTVRVLMWAAEQKLITTDFILLPCDLLLSPSNPTSPTISLAALIDRHRTDDNLITSLFSTRQSGNVLESKRDQEGPAEILTIFSRRNDSQGSSSTGTGGEEEECVLLDVREMDEFDHDEVPLRVSLLNKYPSPTLTTSLLPTQLYIFSSLLLPLLASASSSSSTSSSSTTTTTTTTIPTTTSTREELELWKKLRRMENVQELVGFVSRSYWRKGGHSLMNLLGSTGGGGGGKKVRNHHHGYKSELLAMGRSTTQPPPSRTNLNRHDQYGHPQEGGYFEDDYRGGGGGGGGTPMTGTNTPALVSRSSWKGNSSSLGQGMNGEVISGGNSITSGSRAGTGGCKVVVWTERDGFCARGNTIAGWVEINRASLKLLPPSPPPTSTPSGVFISPDSHLHATVYAQLGEKVGIKRCIVGKGSSIGKGSKLTNSVVMDGVFIGENVKMDNCVVSNGVQIRDRAVLKDCEFGRHVIIDFDSQLKGEQLTVHD